ncbi:glutamate racemase [Oceanomicrobium pacificus]|uniref:Glutamate racemase n=1 Tax=Oceanomicrobium pacificus TaxID=2692916 RepID=A0A6B0TXW2_9RHOB|nr:aspartate/glutamate racemase family protein [Oceanomicrobium pacificus]MXU66288.1 glutamate racemase [Oceanomicrobium pacificus]
MSGGGGTPGAAPIGVFDSGLGGLSVLDALRAALPDQPFVYLGDNAMAPYGTRPAEEVHELTRAGCRRLFAAGCDLVILACNTASAVALHDLQTDWLRPPRRVLGVFVPMIEVLSGRAWGEDGPPRDLGARAVGLFATRATVRSNAFAREMRFRARGVTVTQVACEGLVDALEEGDRDKSERLVATHCRTLLETVTHPQTVVLGCTHYPLVSGIFARHLPPATEILSQPQIVARSLADYLQRHPRFAATGGGVTYLTSGDPHAVGAAAARFTGRDRSFAPA